MVIFVGDLVGLFFRLNLFFDEIACVMLCSPAKCKVVFEILFYILRRQIYKKNEFQIEVYRFTYNLLSCRGNAIKEVLAYKA
jgi:hypothetical protein